MLGHEVITALVTRAVRDRVPETVRRRATAKTPDLPVTVPDPENIYPHPVPSQDIGAFPALMVEELETGPRYTTRQVTVSGSTDVFEFRYVFRVYTYVHGIDYRHTSYQQKYLATSLRMALLADRCLFESEEERAVIDPNSFRESFSNVARDADAEKYLSGHYAEFEIIATETSRSTEIPDEVFSELRLTTGLMHQDSTEPVPPTLTTEQTSL